MIFDMGKSINWSAESNAMTTIPEEFIAAIRAEAVRRGLVPPSGGNDVTHDVSVCRQSHDHDFVFLRDNVSGIMDMAAKGCMPRIPDRITDTFYCRHCLVYRTVERK